MSETGPNAGRHSDDVMERIAALPGELYVFIDYQLPDGRDVPIGDLRQRLLAQGSRDGDVRPVILVDEDRLAALEERLSAVLNHRDILPTFSSGALQVLVALGVGGGGIGDIRRVIRLEKSKDGQYSGLVPTSDVLKIVERPHKNLANTDLEVLQETLPRLADENSHVLTGVLGISRAERREQLTIVQHLEFIPGFVSFRKVLDDVSHPFCSAPFLLEVLKQAAMGLQVLHSHGIAHRDFKADAIVLQWKEDRPSRVRRAIADLLPGEGAPSVSASALYRQCVQGRIYDYDTVAVVGRSKDPSQTTSSSENARIENPRELAEVYAQSDQYPLGIALLRLFPAIWSEVRGVMRSGMAVAVPMKLMMVREDLESRKNQIAQLHATLYGCSSEDALLLTETLLRLIAFEPEERFDNLGEVVATFSYLQGKMSHEGLATLMANHAHLFDDAEQLIAGLSRRNHEGAGTFFAEAAQVRAGLVRMAAPWAAVLLAGAVVGGGMTRLSQDTPTPVANTEVVALIEKVEPTPIPETQTPAPLRLDLGRMDWQALDGLESLEPGGTLSIPLPAESGEDGAVDVRRGEGPEKHIFHYAMNMPGQEKQYAPSSWPLETVRELMMSEIFTNYCHGSDPERMRQFINRMPAEPKVNSGPIRTRFTFCEGSEPHFESMSVERQSRLQFAISLGEERLISRKPRVDACEMVNELAISRTGQGAFASCSNLGLKFATNAVMEVAEPEPDSVVAEPLVLKELSIDNTDEEIIFAAREIAGMSSNHKVLLRLDGKGPIEIIKTERRLTFNGKTLNVASGSEYSALLKAIHRSAEQIENL